MRKNNNQRHIAIDARCLLLPLRGIPLYVTRLCHYLPALDKRYLYFMFINKGFEHSDSPDTYQPRLDEILNKHDNVQIVNCDSDAEIMWEQVYLPRLIKEHKIDLLHMPGNRICFFPGVPTVVTIHDVIEFKRLKRVYLQDIITKESSLRMMSYIARTSAYVWANYKFGFGRAAQVITVSEYSSTDIIETLKISPSKVTTIHHGLDDEFVFGDAVAASHIECGSRDFVLMLGGDSPHKNPEGAISAWAKVPEEIRRKYPLRIIGFCGNDHSPLLQALRKYGLQNEVEIIGWVTQKELIDYLRSAALFIYLSRYEGFGFPPLHAMACGTPVIASNCTSIPEVLGDVGFKYDPDDHAGVAAGVEKILNDQTLWQQQSVAGIARSKSFSWEESAIKHLKVYESVMEKYCGSTI